MNRNDFRNPLIQSGILLLIVFLFISIVANSPADGFFGSIFALVSGIVKGLLFIIALGIGLVFSIAVLFGIFIMAISFHSVEKARNMFEQLKTALTALYCKMRRCDDSAGSELETSAPPPSTVKEPAPLVTPEAADPPEEVAVQKEIDHRLEKKIGTLEEQVELIQSSLASVEKQLTIPQSPPEEEQASALDHITDTLKNLEENSTGLADTIQHQSTELASVVARVSTLEKSVTTDLDALKQKIDELQKKTSVPEVVSGILAYIDTQEERDALAEKAEEAVSRGMTYAQTDEFFKKSLPASLHKALAEHPRLTKDFIRSVKKKFE